MRLTLLILLLISAFAPWAWAARTVVACADAYLKLAEVVNDSAVELEMPLTKEVLNILTTTDGTVGSILPAERMPKALAFELSRGAPRTLAGDLLWDDLPAELKIKVLKEAGKTRTELPYNGFYQDRKMAGIKVKEKVMLRFRKETTFLGKKYPPGNNLVDIAGLFGPVEYRAPGDVTQLQGVELHFRTARPAGEVSRDAATFQAGIGINPLHQHLHMVTPLPLAQMKENPPLYAAMMGDYYRRANLLAECISVFNRGKIATNKTGDVIWFDSLSRENLNGVTAYLYNRGYGGEYAIGDNFKMGWIGMRGSDKYDAPGLWGFEYRSLNPEQNPFAMHHTLDALQYGLVKHDYGLDLGTYQRWMEAGKIDPMEVNVAVAKNWYRTDAAPKQLIELLPKDLRAGLDEKALIKRLDSNLPTHRELQMLFHDWSMDPLFFESESAKQNILREQRIALEDLAKGKEINDTMQNFLWDSGIMQRLGSSLHLGLRTESERADGYVGYVREVTPLPRLKEVKSKDPFWQKFLNLH